MTLILQIPFCFFFQIRSSLSLKMFLLCENERALWSVEKRSRWLRRPPCWKRGPDVGAETPRPGELRRREAARRPGGGGGREDCSWGPGRALAARSLRPCRGIALCQHVPPPPVPRQLPQGTAGGLGFLPKCLPPWCSATARGAAPWSAQPSVCGTAPAVCRTGLGEALLGTQDPLPGSSPGARLTW